MATTPWIKAPTTTVFKAENESTGDSSKTPLDTNQSSRLFRSKSIQDQLNSTPKVAPHWGHSISKSYGSGNDWPLPAPGSSIAISSTPPSSGALSPAKIMSSGNIKNEELWSEQGGPKKRGPKPKNEPATTRRQQLNRIAQRAHRDRKELYIKNLESEVKRFRNAYTTCLTDLKRMAEENRLLKEEVNAFRSMSGLPSEDVIMTQAQFSLPPPQPSQSASPFIVSPQQPQPSPQAPSDPISSPPRGLSRVFGKLKRKDSQSGIRISPPLQSLNEFERFEVTGSTKLAHPFQSGHHAFPPSPPHGSQSSGSSPPQSGHGRTLSNVSTLQSQGMEQPLAAVALQFIVRLEAVCMDHLHAAQDSELDPESAPHGHALMGSTLSYISSPSTNSPHSLYAYGSSTASPGAATMDQRTLEVLLNLNFQTNNGEYINTMGGQIYGPISVLDAWNLVSSHKKFGKFDLDAVASRLVPQVTCRGYGPILETEDVFKAIDEVSSGQVYGRI